MDLPRTPSPRVPYERYSEVMAEYEGEKRQAEEIQNLKAEMETAHVS